MMKSEAIVPLLNATYFSIHIHALNIVESISRSVKTQFHVAATAQDIDTRSDIYSLGVILYELLIGALPFDPKELRKSGVDHRQRELGDDHPETLETKNDLAVLYKEKGKYGDAQRLLLEAVNGRTEKLGPKHPHTQESIKNLIELYEAWNKPEEAEEWRAKPPKTEAVGK